MGHVARRQGRAAIRAGTQDSKIGPGQLLQQGERGHTTPNNIWRRGETGGASAGLRWKISPLRRGGGRKDLEIRLKVMDCSAAA